MMTLIDDLLEQPHAPHHHHCIYPNYHHTTIIDFQPASPSTHHYQQQTKPTLIVNWHLNCPQLSKKASKLQTQPQVRLIDPKGWRPWRDRRKREMKGEDTTHCGNGKFFGFGEPNSGDGSQVLLHSILTKRIKSWTLVPMEPPLSGLVGVGVEIWGKGVEGEGDADWREQPNLSNELRGWGGCTWAWRLEEMEVDELREEERAGEILLFFFPLVGSQRKMASCCILWKNKTLLLTSIF